MKKLKVLLIVLTIFYVITSLFYIGVLMASAMAGDSFGEDTPFYKFAAWQLLIMIGFSYPFSNLAGVLLAWMKFKKQQFRAAKIAIMVPLVFYALYLISMFLVFG